MPRSPTALLILAVTIAGLSQTVTAGDKEIEHGKRIVERNCSRCHSVGRTGASPLNPALPFRELSRRYPLDNLAEALAEGIMTGHPAMPVFKFEPHEIDAILGYIESISPHLPPAGAADTPK